MKKKEITLEEWFEYEWIPTENAQEFIRGFKKTSPPDDGFKYVEITTYSDKEQRWGRAIEFI